MSSKQHTWTKVAFSFKDDGYRPQEIMYYALFSGNSEAPKLILFLLSRRQRVQIMSQ